MKRVSIIALSVVLVSVVVTVVSGCKEKIQLSTSVEKTTDNIQVEEKATSQRSDIKTTVQEFPAPIKESISQIPEEVTPQKQDSISNKPSAGLPKTTNEADQNIFMDSTKQTKELPVFAEVHNYTGPPVTTEISEEAKRKITDFVPVTNTTGPAPTAATNNQLPPFTPVTNKTGPAKVNDE